MNFLKSLHLIVRRRRRVEKTKEEKRGEERRGEEKRKEEKRREEACCLIMRPDGAEI